MNLKDLPENLAFKIRKNYTWNSKKWHPYNKGSFIINIPLDYKFSIVYILEKDHGDFPDRKIIKIIEYE